MSETHVSTEGTVLRVERTIAATIDAVWQAWTNKDMFEKWWGPKGWQTTVKHLEFQVDGYLLYGMKCLDPNQGEWYGKYSWGKSVYTQIDEPHSFTYTDYFCDENGEVTPGMPAISVRMQFEEVEGGTRIVSTSDIGSEEALKQLMDMGMIEGLKQTWDRLEETVAVK